VRFTPFAPLSLDNFVRAWEAAPFARYFFNAFVLVTLILACQLVLCTLAATFTAATSRLRWSSHS
jgi:sn-glycerol 3-phosphate transport system permease protein